MQSIQGTYICTSPCCKQFVVTIHDEIICSQCKQPLLKSIREENGNVLLASNFRSNTSRIATGSKQMSSFTTDQLKYQMTRMKRYAVDPTFELCDVKCEKCKSYCRYCRGLDGNLVFICSNKDCREINQRK